MLLVMKTSNLWLKIVPKFTFGKQTLCTRYLEHDKHFFLLLNERSFALSECFTRFYLYNKERPKGGHWVIQRVEVWIHMPLFSILSLFLGQVQFLISLQFLLPMCKCKVRAPFNPWKEKEMSVALRPLTNWLSIYLI